MIEFIQRIPAWFWIALVAHGVVLGTVAYLILLERKIASWVQDRLGPNRVGPFGLLQPLADGLKFIFKEDYRPKHVDKVLFSIAPATMIAVIIISIAVIPWGGIKQTTKTVSLGSNVTDVRSAAADAVPMGATIIAAQAADQPGQYTVTYRYPFQIASINIGILFILAVLSLAVYGVVVGGWASNNKYSFLGGLRATANMISYEVPLGLTILAIVLMFGTLDLGQIVEKQASYWGAFTIGGHTFGIPAWNVFCQPLAFLLFLICIHAEANRAPFDIAEAEQELVGGYHTEYSSMRFALFFLAEYAGMITTSAVCVTLFFGGWHFPGLGGTVDPANPAVTTSLWVCIVRGFVLFAKTLIIIGIFMWVRWSLPRFRFDQIMDMAWRAMIPMSLGLLLATALVVYFLGDTPRAFMRINGRMALALLGANVVVLAVSFVVSRLIPEGPDTNRKVQVVGSRFTRTPLPGSPVAPPAPAQHPHGDTGPAGAMNIGAVGT